MTGIPDFPDHDDAADLARRHKESLFPSVGLFYDQPIELRRGERQFVYDGAGRQYLDFFGGIATVASGHAIPEINEPIKEQIDRIIHSSTLFLIRAQIELAERLREMTPPKLNKAFFCNSGTEANEGAIKLARLHGSGSGRFRIISFEDSFHGRTYAAVTATAQPKYHEGIGPLVPGFDYAPRNDLEAVRRLCTHETAGILIEPVQGEGGVNIPHAEFLAGLRRIADDCGALLIFDEVQTGMARLGTWFGYQQWHVQPDILTMAKGLAGGVPCGAIIATPEVSKSLKPGKHASTFGGNPLAMVAGLATIETIVQDQILANVARQSARFKSHFETLQRELSIIREVRVRGMMIGIDLTIPGTPAVGMSMQRGVLINCTHNTVIRLLPALNITDAQVDEGAAVVSEVLRELAQQHHKAA